jgi:hypothetical protein
MIPRHLLGLSAGLFLGATTLCADVLILEDGRRFQGQLVSANPTTVVFDADSGTRTRARRMRVSTADVQRISFRDNDRLQRDDDGTVDPWGRDDDRFGTGTERDIYVDARRQWTDTGINVRAGDTVYFTPEGTVIWGPGRQDTAAGEYNSPVNRARPIPSRPAAGLIGRIGNSMNDVFFIGDERGPFRVHNTGRLYLGINDDYLQDNSGSFRVMVRQ